MNQAAEFDNSNASEPELVLTRRFEAAPSRVFAALSEPERIALWMHPRNGSIIFDTHEFHVGGEYRFTLIGQETTHVTRGRFLEIDPPLRLVYTMVWENGVYADIETTVEIVLCANGEGTDLTLTQRRFNTIGMRDDHNGGWSDCFDHLAQTL